MVRRNVAYAIQSSSGKRPKTMTNKDIAYLTECLKHPHPKVESPYSPLSIRESVSASVAERASKAWYSSEETVLTVARILDQEGYFLIPRHVIDYFEKPWHWEQQMKNTIEEAGNRP